MDEQNKFPPEADKPLAYKILIVDDDDIIRETYRQVFQEHGFESIGAKDGVEGIDLATKEKFDVILTGIIMPRMDGFTLVAELKKNPKLAHIPVIMVTSLEKPEDRERGLSLGANAYVLKQKFDQGALLETIRQIL